MKKKTYFAFGCLTSLILIILFIIIGIILAINFLKNDNPKIEKNSYLTLNLSGDIPLYHEYKTSLKGNDLTLHSLKEKIAFAKNDPNIKGLILLPNNLNMGLASCNELMQEIQNFKKNNKKVFAYLNFADDKDYFLSSCADSIFIHPSSSAGIFLSGIGSTGIFIKNLLNKIGIEFSVVKAGKCKGYGETYYKNNYSLEVKKNLQNMYGNLYDTKLKVISKNRNIPIEKIKEIYEKRNNIFIEPNYALENKLVDCKMSSSEMSTFLNIKQENLVDIEDYKIKNKVKLSQNIALVYMEGAIISGNGISAIENNISAEKYLQIFDDIEEDKKIKAIVLCVDSPGGSALESDIILNRIAKIKIPLVVYMANVAASGAYYISCKSDYIYANLFTITGSIGVIGLIPNFNKLATKTGINSEEINFGKFANPFNPLQKINYMEIASLQNNIDNVYLEFKNNVAKGRKIKDVESLAQGQVYLSETAQKISLVDEIGFLKDALQKAASLGKLKEYSLKIYPEKKNYLNFLFDNNIENITLKNLKSLNFDIIKEYNLSKEFQKRPIQMLNINLK